MKAFVIHSSFRDFQVKQFLLQLFFFMALFFGCRQKSPGDASMSETRIRMSKISHEVLTYYQGKNDTLGYNSAVFLFNNIYGLGAIDATTGKHIADGDILSSSYLIDNIDNALKFSRGKIQEGTLSFANFCEYILPYRLASELLIPWRDECQKRFNTYTSAIDHKKAILEINQQLRVGFEYNLNATNANFQTWKQLSASKKGDCWAMAYSAIYPMRALGIPVTVDYVPRWGNVNGGSHAWNVLINQNNSCTPFVGCESVDFKLNPLKIYYQTRIPGKVFRKIFSKNQLICAINQSSNAIPTSFNTDPQITDVTDQYVQTENFIFFSPRLKGQAYAYICVYSNGDWIPVHAGKVDGSECLFEKMPTGVLFIVGLPVKKRLRPISAPFVLSDNKESQTFFQPNGRSFIDVEVYYTEPKIIDEQKVFHLGVSGDAFYQTMDSVNADTKRSRPIPDTGYKLHFYNNGWKFHSRANAENNKKLVFKNVPANTLYKLTTDSPTGRERMFGYLNGNQIWF
ncbi:transglutaminase-like domain-containing protein [Dyadobacter tibetensis]|uniref:transglutaminase-like domain-containing protein n=1 Tax=Dyadobacter tibetensis TaxID=1211851 RepID=UPI0018DC08FB|nr:transglutaminase-like domain-containing protein [Dyadobacter tibetensis]